jgi:hypothetical protein
VRVTTTRPKAVELTAMPLCMALWQRGREATPSFRELIGHADAGSQYTFIPYPEHLGDEDIPPSIGSVADAYDNALMKHPHHVLPRRPSQTAKMSSTPPPAGSIGAATAACTRALGIALDIAVVCPCN